jgi:hypothetical protein
MNEIILPGLAVTILAFLAVYAWLIYRPQPVKRGRGRAGRPEPD